MGLEEFATLNNGPCCQPRLADDRSRGHADAGANLSIVLMGDPLREHCGDSDRGR
jgi:hypothetical protein